VGQEHGPRDAHCAVVRGTGDDQGVYSADRAAGSGMLTPALLSVLCSSLSSVVSHLLLPASKPKGRALSSVPTTACEGPGGRGRRAVARACNGALLTTETGHTLLLCSIQTEDKHHMYTRVEGSLVAVHHPDIHRNMRYSYCLNWHFHQLLT
jgi:hypothetical protein